ncbi:hypothetical protein Syun_003976 [Stephania yunnanensis]|uniref:Uncharacterized protein n=1 Tax=Stephania yunnanensis TaxID=152371 RepID=A0AAP0Q241_9MAGN
MADARAPVSARAAMLTEARGDARMITSHDQQLQEILRLLRARATTSPSMSAALLTQTGNAPTVHDPSAAPPVQE